MDEVESLRTLLQTHGSISPASFPANTTLFSQNSDSHLLYIILEGRVALFRVDEEGNSIRVDDLGPGDLMGLLAYLRRTQNFTTGITTEDSRMLVLPWADFDTLQSKDNDFARLMSRIVTRNFIARYERVVRLSIDRSHLNRALELERKALQETIIALRETRNRLISQEKLAILGQLVAGLAHELNNPVAAQASASRQLESVLEEIVRKGSQLNSEQLHWLKIGYESELPSTAERRKRQYYLREIASQLDPLFRERACHLPPEAWEKLTADLRRNVRKAKEWETPLALLDLASTTRTLRIAGERIGGLVKSLKQYSRKSLAQPVELSLAEGLEDTLRIVSNRIKPFQLIKELSEVGTIEGDPGELNQVWTNLIINACDAMENKGPEEGILTLRLREKDSDTVLVEIADNGPGVPPSLRERVFEPSFTTKQAGLQFGLGLGLTISKEIIERHGGVLLLEDNPGGGACFIAELPRHQQFRQARTPN